jgi:hypothetical protein
MNAMASVFTDGKTFDDWLSPILVKELRQGMRARVFVISFLLLQVFLSVLVLANLFAQGDHQALQEQSYYFWVIIGFALLVLMPLRGLVAVSHEIRNRTMETIMLTRMTAWRVVFGKWSALFAQSLLLVSASLPYVVLRYFIGGDDIVSDFVWLMIFLWLSGLLIAASIAISALGNAVIRIIILIGLVIFVSVGAGSVSSPGFWLGSPWEVTAWLALFGLFIPALLFELTASSLAPASENHAIRRRFLAILFFVLALLLAGATKTDFTTGVLAPFVILVGICYFELAEKARVIPRMVRSFGSRGVLGRIGAIFLLPGWPSALLFSLLVLPPAMAGCYLFIPPDTTVGWLFPLLAIFGSVLVPAFFCHTFWPRLNNVLLVVVLYNVILLGLVSVSEGFSLLTHTPVDPVLGFFPSLAVLSVAMNAYQDAFRDHMAWYFLGNGIVLGGLIIWMLAASGRYFHNVFAVLRSDGKLPPLPNRKPGMDRPSS